MYTTCRTITKRESFKMGFKEIKNKVIDLLNTGYVLHEQRGDIDIKNLLSTGAISVNEVTNIIGQAKGHDYSCSPHLFDANIDVHILKTKFSSCNWYIK